MEIYEQPRVELLMFLAKESVASENVPEPSLTSGDNISLGEVPGFTEGVEDW